VTLFVGLLRAKGQPPRDGPDEFAVHQAGHA